MYQPRTGERLTKRKQKLRRGDVLTYGDLTLTCLGGSGLKVRIEAPASQKYEIRGKRALTKPPPRS